MILGHATTAITLLDADGVSLLDFKFNGWGLKFASDKDNLITRRAVESEVMKGKYVNRLGFVLGRRLSKVTAWVRCSPPPNACFRLTGTDR